MATTYIPYRVKNLGDMAIPYNMSDLFTGSTATVVGSSGRALGNSAAEIFDRMAVPALLQLVITPNPNLMLDGPIPWTDDRLVWEAAMSLSGLIPSGNLNTIPRTVTYADPQKILFLFCGVRLTVTGYIVVNI